MLLKVDFYRMQSAPTLRDQGAVLKKASRVRMV